MHNLPADVGWLENTRTQDNVTTIQYLLNTIGWQASTGYQSDLNNVHRCLMTLFRKLNKTLFLLLIGLIVYPEQVWALQSHAAPEGIYVHQLAHIFFLAALCYLFWDIRRSSFPSKGWRFLQIFCVLMVLWNIVAFTGHWIGFFMDKSYFVTESGYLSAKLAGPVSTTKLIYYFTKLDHIFSVPALFCLYLCMRSLYKASCEEGDA